MLLKLNLFLFIEDGSVFVFGNGEYGKIGLENEENKYKPVQLMKDKNIKIILGGKYDYQFEKNRISSFGFYLCFPSIEKKFGFKIPKVLKKEIIKNLNNPPMFL